MWQNLEKIGSQTAEKVGWVKKKRENYSYNGRFLSAQMATIVTKNHLSTSHRSANAHAADSQFPKDWRCFRPPPHLSRTDRQPVSKKRNALRYRSTRRRVYQSRWQRTWRKPCVIMRTSYGKIEDDSTPTLHAAFESHIQRSVTCIISADDGR